MSRRTYVLPTIILGPADINRTLLELRELEDYLRQATLRKTADVKLPKTSQSLDNLAVANKVDLLQSEDREHMVAFLESLQQHAPVLHISFASEPSAEFTARIVEWLRTNVSRYTLVQVGLQPSIAAGCIVRSTNKVFDLSLRRHLQKSKPRMIEMLGELRARSEAVPAAAIQEPQA